MRLLGDLPYWRSLLLRDYDYSADGAYFVIILTQDREWLSGDPVREDMRLNVAGNTVEDTWRDNPIRFPGIGLSSFVVMPNHVYGALFFVGAGLAPVRNTGYGCSTETIIGSSLMTHNQADTSLERAGTSPARTGDTGDGRIALGSIIGAFKSITTHAYIVE